MSTALVCILRSAYRRVLTISDRALYSVYSRGAVAKEIFDLRVLLDGVQFEVFAAGGRANIANRYSPDYNKYNRTASFAFVECAGAEVQVQVDGWTMDTCYEVVP